MCLKIDINKHPKLKPLIATKDIYTLKIAYYINEQKCKSYFQNDIQFFKVLLPKININIKTNFTSIQQGYHSLLTNFIGVLSGEYFDSSLHEKCIILCKIPEGSKYFIGNDDDIVSEQLELIQPILINNKTVVESSINNIKSTYIKTYSSISKDVFDDCVQHCKKAGYKIGL